VIDEPSTDTDAPRLIPTPPAGIPLEDARPLPTIQRTRHEALRLAVQHYRDIRKSFDDVDVIATAHLFNEFIRTGTVPERKQES
jgi:hypothetical protein